MDLDVVLKILGVGAPVLVILGARMFLNAMKARNVEAKPEYVLGTLASALGLSIVRGDPAFHLINGADPNPLYSAIGVTKWDVDLLLEGTPYGRPTRLSIVEKMLRVKIGRARLVDSHTHQSRLILSGVRLPARFECWTEGVPYLAAHPTLGLPAVHRGSGLHCRWVVATDNAAAIQPAFAQLDALAQVASYLHVVGTDDRIELVMGQVALMTLVPQLPTLLQGLAALARTLETGAPARA